MRGWRANPECENMAQRRKVLRLLMSPRFGFWRNGKVLKLDCGDTAQLCKYIKQPLDCTLKMGEFYDMQIISIKLLKMKKERMKVFKKNNNPEPIQRVSENKLWQEWHFPTNNTFILISAPCTSRSLFKDKGMDYSECFPKQSLL